MFLLVNLEDHLFEMGEIVAGLVNKYSVPISIVDRVEKLCPRCSNATECKKSICKNESLPKIDESPCEPTPLNPLIPLMERYQEIVTNNSNDVLAATKNSAALLQSIDLHTVSKQILPSVAPTMINIDEHPESSATSISCPSEKEEVFQPTSSNSIAVDSDSIPISAVEAEEATTAPADSASEGVEAGLEALHPSILACLLSSTPSVFAHYTRLTPSPLDQSLTASKSSSPENKTFKIDPDSSPGSNSNKRNLGHVVSASGKVRRGRIVYNTRDLEILERFYNEDPNACADPLKKKQLMEILGIDALRVKVWFQNRRRKDKLRWLNEIRT